MRQFWTLTDDHSGEMESDVIEGYRTIKNTCRLLMMMHCSNAAGFLVAAMISSDNILPIECYRPEWIGYSFLLLYQEGVALLTILIPVMAMDFFFMATLRLTEIQFRLLNREIKNMFKITEDVPKELFSIIVEDKLKRCVERHNFLLSYVQLINETFSSSLLIFRTIIIMSMCVEMYILSTE
ncbi:unnamed protein product [Phaedon cochleariae]|uniref:Uncharacterized protein n=1 Tax=Phaedon cochleariae TaxID=80249 RepID=A0A9N9SCN2_PHACE|nr:unnamed protein product [Phaedon cochleariae]